MADRSYKLTLSLSDGSTINAGTITAPQGPNGANGSNGATFTPSVSAAGILSWTNNGGLTNPPPISIKGPKGDDAVITASDVENWGFTKNKGTVTSVAVKINGTIKGTVTSSGTIDLGTVLTAHQDISGKANLSGGNTFTGKQTLNSPGSDGYSINAAGYVKGSWLQASAIANKGANTGKVCVFDNSGWIYYRTPAEILAEAGGVKASDIPDVSGKANLIGGNTFAGQQTFDDDAYVNGDLYNSSSMQTRSFSLTDDGLGGDEAISAGFSQNGTGFIEMGGTIECALILKGDAGSSGQALLSQGASKTPIWRNVVGCSGPQTIIGNLTLAPEQTGYVLDCYNYNSNNNDTVFGIQIDEQETQYDKGVICIGDGYAVAEVSLGNNVGSKGQVFTSNGPGQTPAWTSIEDKIKIKNYSCAGVHPRDMMFNTDKWSTKTWSGLTNFTGDCVWTDGGNIYYSKDGKHYVLNKATSTWSTKTWSGITDFTGDYVWTDGDNIYYSNGSKQYVLNKATSTWSTKTWSGLTSFTGNCIWTDGDNIYYSSYSKQYVLNKATSTWSTKTWSGLTSFYGRNVWTDGDNIYCVYDNKTYYVLNKATSTWSTKTFSGGPGYISVGRIWTDGDNIYYSNGSDQYVLNKATSTWSTKTWSGLTNPIASYVWTDGDNIYYSGGSSGNYILNKYKISLLMQSTFN